MITLGLDPHPGSHTVVALDGNGCLLANATVPNTVPGLSDLLQFAGRFGSRRWAVEGAGNHFVATFVTELLARGEAVYSIAPSLTSQYRSRRGRKKNDVVDAANVARLFWLTQSFRFGKELTNNARCRRCLGHNSACLNNLNLIGLLWQS